MEALHYPWTSVLRGRGEDEDVVSVFHEFKLAIPEGVTPNSRVRLSREFFTALHLDAKERELACLPLPNGFRYLRILGLNNDPRHQSDAGFFWFVLGK